MNGLSRLLLALFCLNSMTVVCMHPRDEHESVEGPLHKVRRTAAGSSCAIDVGEPASEDDFEEEFLSPAFRRSSATLFIVNQKGGGGGVIDFDNGAIPSGLAAALQSKKSVVLVNRTVAVPLLLFSQFKSLSIEEMSVVHGVECDKLIREILDFWKRLCEGKCAFDDRLELLRQIKQSIRRLPRVNFDEYYRRYPSLPVIFNWMKLAQQVDFDQLSVCLFSQSDFMLLVPAELVDSWQAFGPDLEEYPTPFADHLWIAHTVGRFREDRADGAAASVRNALERLFSRDSYYRWAVIFFGHGSQRYLAGGAIAGISERDFFDAVDFLNARLGTKVNVVCWKTCFGGGGRADRVLEHLREKNASRPANFCMIALNPLDTVSVQSFTTPFFEEMDDLFVRCASEPSREMIDEFLRVIGNKMSIGQVLLLAPGADAFNVVTATHEPLKDQEKRADVSLRSALTSVGGVTKKSLEVFAHAMVLLDAQKLKELLAVLESTSSDCVDRPSEFFLAQARARENVYALINAARVGISLRDVPMTALLAHRADGQIAVACAFVNQLALGQRAELMRIAVENNCFNLMAALLGVEMPLSAPVAIGQEFASKIYELPALPLACAIRTLNDVQREELFRHAKAKNVVFDAMSDYFARAYANPASARITQRLAAYVEKNISSEEMPGVVDCLCMAQAGAWLYMSVLEGAPKLTELLLDRGAHFTSEVADVRFCNALCSLCSADFDVGARVVAVLNDAQRVTIGALLSDAFSKKRSAAASVRGQISLFLHLLAQAPCEVVVPELNKGELEAFKSVLEQHSQALADAFDHMTDAQRNALRDGLAHVADKYKCGFGTKCLAHKLMLFFDFLSNPDAALEEFSEDRAEVVDRLPQGYIRRLFDASSHEQRCAWKTAIDSCRFRGLIYNVGSQLAAYHAPWRLLEKEQLDNVVLYCLGKEGWRRSAEKISVEIGIAFILERALDTRRARWLGAVPLLAGSAVATISSLNAQQRCDLAEIAVLFQLGCIKQALLSMGVVVPSQDDVIFKPQFLKSLVAYASNKSSFGWSSLCVHNFSPLHRYTDCLTIRQKRELADYAVRCDKLNVQALFFCAGPFHKEFPVTPEMVALINHSSIAVLDFLAVRTADQLNQIATIAQFCHFNRILDGLKSMGVSVPALHSICANEELVRVLNERYDLFSIMKNFSDEQKQRMFALGLATDSRLLCAALMADGAVDIRDLSITAGVVFALGGLPSIECGMAVMRRLSDEQFWAVERIALLLDFDRVIAYCSSDRRFKKITSTELEIDEDLARCFGDICHSTVEKLIERCTPVQRNQLFFSARRFNLDNILMGMAVFDASRYSLSEIPVGLERVESSFIQAQIIASFTDEQRFTLAGLAQLYDWADIKKQLFIQQIMLPEVCDIVVNDQLVCFLNRAMASSVFFEQFSDVQLMAVYDIAKQKTYASVILAFQSDCASDRLSQICLAYESKRAVC